MAKIRLDLADGLALPHEDRAPLPRPLARRPRCAGTAAVDDPPCAHDWDTLLADPAIRRRKAPEAPGPVRCYTRRHASRLGPGAPGRILPVSSRRLRVSRRRARAVCRADAGARCRSGSTVLARLRGGDRAHCAERGTPGYASRRRKPLPSGSRGPPDRREPLAPRGLRGCRAHGAGGHPRREPRRGDARIVVDQASFTIVATSAGGSSSTEGLAPRYCEPSPGARR